MKNIFGFVMVGSNNLNTSAKFYDAIFIPLDIKKIKTTEKLGVIGKEKAVACEVIASVIKND